MVGGSKSVHNRTELEQIFSWPDFRIPSTLYAGRNSEFYPLCFLWTEFWFSSMLIRAGRHSEFLSLYLFRNIMFGILCSGQFKIGHEFLATWKLVLSNLFGEKLGELLGFETFESGENITRVERRFFEVEI